MTPMHAAEFTVPCRLPELTFGPITATDIVRYAGASGDFNPLHHDHDAAVAAGFPGIFSMGMYPASRLAAYASDWFGPQQLRRISLRFRRQVWPGDILVCTGEAVSISARGRESIVLVELQCAQQAGPIVVDGSADFVLPAAAPC